MFEIGKSINSTIDAVLSSTFVKTVFGSPLILGLVILIVIYLILNVILDQEVEITKTAVWMYVGIIGCICLYSRVVLQDVDSVKRSNNMAEILPSSGTTAYAVSDPSYVPMNVESFDFDINPN